ncbi:MAG: hypothetical protein HZA58_09180 [Acidimicrobiia bacterium]|nr:hypothetical protein [Acidimicrobiia bacterium]
MRVNRMSRMRPDERGASLVELGVVMMGIAILGALMTTWFSSVTRTDRLHQRDDVSSSEIRDLENLIGRDIRRAIEVTVAQPDSFTIWLDDNRDGVVGTAELVTWRVVDGMLERSAGGITEHPATDLALPGTTFFYDAAEPSAVTAVTLEFAVVVGGTERRVRSQITLRNLWG